jgi:hypothetical protein
VITADKLVLLMMDGTRDTWTRAPAEGRLALAPAGPTKVRLRRINVLTTGHWLARPTTGMLGAKFPTSPGSLTPSSVARF